jgi:hypothetical protein
MERGAFMKGHYQPPLGSSQRLEQPLDPLLLQKIGAYDRLPLPDGKLRSYRIWGSNAQTSFQNKNMGHMTIAVQKGEFQVNRVIVHADGIKHIIDASVNLQNQEPSHWSLRSQFTDTSGCIRPELTMDISGKRTGNSIEQRSGGFSRSYELKGVFFLDWILFLQGGRIEKNLKADYLENLYLLKNDQYFSPSGISPVPGHGECRKISHYGRSVPSRDYYFDKKGAALLAITDQYVYILDNDAKEATEQLVEDLTTGGVYYEY